MSDFPPIDEVSPSSQVVPQSREAEEALLGAVLINPEAYYDVAQFLRGDDFYIHRHRWVWEAFVRLNEQRTPIDFLTVSEELERTGQLGEVGGAAYLTALVSNVPYIAQAVNVMVTCTVGTGIAPRWVGDGDGAVARRWAEFGHHMDVEAGAA